MLPRDCRGGEGQADLVKKAALAVFRQKGQINLFNLSQPLALRRILQIQALAAQVLAAKEESLASARQVQDLCEEIRHVKTPQTH